MNLPPRKDAVRQFWVAIRAGASTEDVVAGLAHFWSGGSQGGSQRYSNLTRCPRARLYPSNWSVSPSPAKPHLPSHRSCLAIRGNPVTWTS